ncbi:MAG: 16S rRNA (uracil(1498)-N(3))-methyltransferase [Eggerthellaceae bacterium]
MLDTPGEHIAVVDAAQDYFEREIAAFDDAVPVSTRSASTTRSALVMLVGPGQGRQDGDGDRHATELGVSAFVPMSCERSIVRLDARKARRGRSDGALAKSATMQSGQRACPGWDRWRWRMCAPSGARHRRAGVLGGGAADAHRRRSKGLRLDRALPNARIAVVVGPKGLSQARGPRASGLQPACVAVSLGSHPEPRRPARAPALVLHELAA